MNRLKLNPTLSVTANCSGRAAAGFSTTGSAKTTASKRVLLFWTGYRRRKTKMPCAGNANDHCCYIAGKPCKYVEENTVKGRRWACGLRRELGDWDLVLEDPRYKKDVAPVLAQWGYNCRDWPDSHPGMKCSDCGYGSWQSQ